jgi:phosphoribosylanthranilate isomerase
LTDIKFCGLTRRMDADYAAALGARYCGVVFASGPRMVSPEHAVEILPTDVGRVGVFGYGPPAEIAGVAVAVGLNVIQLHEDPTPSYIERVRGHFNGEIWATVRTASDELPGGVEGVAALFAAADAVLLDARVPGALGGTGKTLPWEALARAVEQARGTAGRLVLAGGLTPDNVARAAAALSPDIVDTSSGIERSPGVKDHARMEAFVAALRPTGTAP